MENQRRFSTPNGSRLEEENLVNEQQFESLIYQGKLRYNLGNKTFLSYKPHIKRVSIAEQSKRLISVLANTTERKVASIETSQSIDQRLKLDHRFNDQHSFHLEASHLYTDRNSDYRIASEDPLFTSLLRDSEISDIFQLEDNISQFISAKGTYLNRIGLQTRLRFFTGYQYNDDNLNSTIQNEEETFEALSNTDASFTVKDYFGGIKLSQKIGSLDLQVSGTAHNYFIKNSTLSNDADHRFFFMPDVSIKQSFADAHFVRGGYKFQVVFPSIQLLASQPIINNYRTTSIGVPSLEQATHHVFDLNYFRNSIWHHYIMTVNFNHSIRQDEFRSMVVTDSTGLQQFVPVNNQPENHSTLMVRFTKNYRKLKINLETKNLLANFKNTINELPIDNRTLRTEVELSVLMEYGAAGDIDFGVRSIFNDFKQNEESFVSSKYVPYLELKQKLWKKVLLSLTGTYSFFRDDRSNQSVDYSNIDASIEYDLARRLKVRTQVKNLLNNDLIFVNTFNSYYSSTQQFNVLERFVTWSLSYRF